MATTLITTNCSMNDSFYMHKDNMVSKSPAFKIAQAPTRDNTPFNLDESVTQKLSFATTLPAPV